MAIVDIRILEAQRRLTLPVHLVNASIQRTLTLPVHLVNASIFLGGPPLLCTQRWIMAYLCFAGFFCVYALRMNLSVALVCMVKQADLDSDSIVLNSSANNTLGVCGEMGTGHIEHHVNGEFNWDKKTQSSVLAAFFYGYIITQVPGGWLSDRFGGHKVYGVSMAISGICTLLFPVGARTSLTLVYALRFILGLVQGVIYPACYSLWGRWAPRYERTTLLSVTSVGVVIGIMTTFSTGGLLCEYGFDNGWASIFYITGGLCCLWTILWFIQVRDSPGQHPRITISELIYLENNTDVKEKKKIKVPWLEMLKSGPCWALTVCHSCGNWADYTLMTSLPIFMKEVLEFDITSNGALSAAPFLCSFVSALSTSKLADVLRRKSVLTTSQTRKIFQSIAFIGSSVFLIATGFVPCSSRELAVIFLCIAVMFTGINTTGYLSNHIDLAPKYAGMFFGITNTAATLPGMISPIVAGALTPDGTAEQWRNVFYVSAAFYVIGTIVFVVFGSGNLQPWGGDIEIEINVSLKSVEDIEDNHNTPLTVMSTNSSEEH